MTVSTRLASPLAFLCLAGAATSQTYRVSGPFTPFIGSDVRGHLVTPDGSRIVYMADAERTGVVEVYSIPRLGGPALRLTANLSGMRSVQSMKLSHDGQWVVFRRGFDASSNDLYSARVDGSVLATVLSTGNYVLGEDDAFRISPDDSRVVYLDDAGKQLHSRPLDGSGTRIKLTTHLDPVQEFELSGDGAHVVYVVDPSGSPLPRVNGVPADGSGAAVTLSGTVVSSFLKFLGARGGFAYYFANQGAGFHSYRAPVDGSAPAAQVSAAVPGGFSSPALSATGARILCLYEPPAGETELISLDASATLGPLTLLASGPDVTEFEIDPTGTYAVFNALDRPSLQFRFHAVPVDGSAPYVTLWDLGSATFPKSGGVLVFSPGGDHVVFRWGAELRYVPLDGSAPAIALTTGPGTPVGLPGLEPKFSHDEALVVFCAQTGVGELELFSSEVTGVGPISLDGGPRPGRVLEEFSVSPVDGQVTFVANEDDPTITELFEVPDDASAPATVLNEPFTALDFGDATALEVSPDGAWAVYLADQDQDETFELYSAPMDGRGPSVKLSPPLPIGATVSEFFVSAQSDRVLFLSDALSGDELELLGAPIDGSDQAVLLSQRPLPGVDVHHVLIGPGPHVVYSVRQTPVLHEWFATAVDGSGPVVDLSVNGNQVVTYLFPERSTAFSPDGERFLTTIGRLLVHQLDGTAAPRNLSGEMVPSSLAPFVSDKEAVFVSNPAGGPDEVFVVPLDGSLLPIPVSDSGVEGTGDIARFAVTPDGRNVIYNRLNADLYSRPVDRSTPPIRLNPAFPPGTTNAIYPIDVSADGRHAIYYNRLSGGLASARIGRQDSEVLLGIANPTVFESTPDGKRVVVLASGRLRSARLGLAGSSVRLDQKKGAGSVFAYHFLPDSSAVIYEADEEGDGLVQLYTVPPDGSSLRVQLTHAPSGVADAALTADGALVAFLADALVSGRVEVCARPAALGPLFRSTRTPR